MPDHSLHRKKQLRLMAQKAFHHTNERDATTTTAAANKFPAIDTMDTRL
jgi:hypothetical protein